MNMHAHAAVRLSLVFGVFLLSQPVQAEVLNPNEPDPDKRTFYMVMNNYSDSLVNKDYRMDVMINRKVSESVLETVALRLKTSNGKELERLFINFYLPGMKLGGWAWATARFNPDLEIKILRKNRNIEEESLSLLHSQWEKLQGEWIYQYPYASSRVVLSKKGGISYLKELYENGSILINPVHPAPVQDGTRFDYETGCGEIGFWIIGNDGNLQRYDDNGPFGESTKVIVQPSEGLDTEDLYRPNALSTVYHSDETIESTIHSLESALESDVSGVIRLMAPNYLYSIDEKQFLFNLQRSGLRDLSINILYMNVERSRAYCVLSIRYSVKQEMQHGLVVLFLRKIDDSWKLANFPFANSYVPNWAQGFPNW